MAGFIVLCIVLAVIQVLLTRKWKGKYIVNVDSPPIRGSRLAGITGSASSSRPSAPDCVTDDLEMEQLDNVLRGIRPRRHSK